MKKRLLMLTLAGCLMATTAFPCMAKASETQDDSLSALLGELADQIGELTKDVDVDALMQNVEEQLSQAEGEVRQAYDEIKDIIKEKADTIDLSEVGQLLGSLLGNGGEELTDEEIADLMADPTGPVIEAYLQEKNADSLEQGDITLFSYEARMEKTKDDGTTLSLITFLQMNYKADGKDLVLVGSARDTMLFTFDTAEDGSVSIREAKATEDGENYTSSLEALCKEYGTTLEDYEGVLEFSDLMDTLTLLGCLKDHPEYERIEYMGELHTLEEMDQIVENS